MLLQVSVEEEEDERIESVTLLGEEHHTFRFDRVFDLSATQEVCLPVVLMLRHSPPHPLQVF